MTLNYSVIKAALDEIRREHDAPETFPLKRRFVVPVPADAETVLSALCYYNNICNPGPRPTRFIEPFRCQTLERKR